MSELAQPLLWQKTVWGKLISLAQKNHLHHAFIFSGPHGIGKYQLASSYASYLLCDSTMEQACGHCKSCSLIQAGTHPDYYLIQPEEKSKIIKIDQVRHLTNELGKTAGLSGRRIIIIHPAEAMNEAAANALLKSLEEPGANTHFFLMAESIDLLPPTIRSRCQLIRLAAPAPQDAASWLKNQLDTQKISTSFDDLTELLRLAGGAPILVLEWIQRYTLPIVLEHLKSFSEDILALSQRKLHPLPCAARWQKNIVPVSIFLLWWSYWLQHHCIQQQGKKEKHQELGKEINFLTQLLIVRQQLQQHPSLNEGLLLEDVLIRWYELHR